MAVKHIEMRTPRALVAANPLDFGRGRTWLGGAPVERNWSVANDLKLFATTFAAGFLFVSIFIG